jgi:hypothetical protein
LLNQMVQVSGLIWRCIRWCRYQASSDTVSDGADIRPHLTLYQMVQVSGLIWHCIRWCSIRPHLTLYQMVQYQASSDAVSDGADIRPHLTLYQMVQVSGFIWRCIRWCRYQASSDTVSDDAGIRPHLTLYQMVQISGLIWHCIRWCRYQASSDAVSSRYRKCPCLTHGNGIHRICVKQNLKSSDDGIQHSESLGLWTCPSSGILNTRKDNVSETWSVSILVWKDPRVEAGKNTSTIIPASRKRRRKGNRISLRWECQPT